MSRLTPGISQSSGLDWKSIAGVLLMAALMGCAHSSYTDRHAPRRAQRHDATLIRPVVAVTDFENRANFSGQWNLGGGMAEMLTERLMATDAVIVLERQHIDGVLGEIQRQARDLFRREGRAERGRLKNARYLIRGVVTDFTVTGDASGWFAAPGARSRFSRSRATVGLYVTLIDVETGQILAAVRTDGAAASGGFAAGIDYRELSFGGDAYFRTPLGRATQQAMEKAVRRTLAEIPAERWQARVAEAGVDGVIINGGVNVGLQPGQRFDVRPPGRSVTDPITGDVIEHIPGRVAGRLEVREVMPMAAHAVLLDGQAQRGDFLTAAD